MQTEKERKEYCKKCIHCSKKYIENNTEGCGMYYYNMYFGCCDSYNNRGEIIMNENKKIIDVVDKALKEYGSDVISVDRDNEDGTMIHINLCGTNWSDAYMLNVARFDKCNIKELEKELDKRNVGHCW